jgi:predicted  nucleic acid-binding Zn-ribbon protein
MDELTILLNVQKLDEEIRELEALSRSVPVEIERFQNELEHLGRTCRKKSEKLKELKVKEREKEGQIDDLNSQRNRYEAQLREAKNNVVYSALKQEIGAVDHEIQGVVELAVALMEQIEELEKEIHQEKETLESHEKEFQDKETTLLERKRKTDERLGSLRKEREEIVVLVPEKLRNRYERIRNSKEGLAVVPLKENICGGCFASIPIQRINEIRHEEDLKSCENCGRIIYYKDGESDEE